MPLDERPQVRHGSWKKQSSSSTPDHALRALRCVKVPIRTQGRYFLKGWRDKCGHANSYDVMWGALPEFTTTPRCPCSPLFKGGEQNIFVNNWLSIGALLTHIENQAGWAIGTNGHIDYQTHKKHSLPTPSVRHTPDTVGTPRHNRLRIALPHFLSGKYRCAEWRSWTHAITMSVFGTNYLGIVV